MDTDRLNNKLTKWVKKDRYGQGRIIQFTQSLDSCFEFLISGIPDLGVIEFEVVDNKIWEVTLWNKDNMRGCFSGGGAETLVLALCLAIEEWINRGEKWI